MNLRYLSAVQVRQLAGAVADLVGGRPEAVEHREEEVVQGGLAVVLEVPSPLDRPAPLAGQKDRQVVVVVADSCTPGTRCYGELGGRRDDCDAPLAVNKTESNPASPASRAAETRSGRETVPNSGPTRMAARFSLPPS